MAERLVKIAKELNVGLATIVDFLASKGHVIENKPTSMVSDEMHDALLKEFRSSMAEKEKADQIVIGSRPGLKDDNKPHAEEKPAPKPLFTIPKLDLDKPAPVASVPAPEVEKPKTPEVEVKEVKEAEAPVESVKEAVKEPTEETEIFTTKTELPKLKVLGKIDLDKPKPAANQVKPQDRPLYPYIAYIHHPFRDP